MKKPKMELELPTVMQALHWIARGAYRGMGYRWKTHRNGDQRIGYWKITLKEKAPSAPYPKRFVLIPGFSDTALSWYLLFVLLRPLFKQEFDEVILVDLPGFGGFLGAERSFNTIDQMMTAMYDVLDYLKPHTIFGHSLGGWLAADYAALCGQGSRPATNRLTYSGPSSIILMSPSGVYSEKQAKEELESVFKAAVNSGFFRLRPHLFAREPFWFRYVVSHYHEMFKRDDIAQFVKSVKSEHAIQEEARHITADVWLLWGEQDGLIPPSCLDGWLKYLNPQHEDRHHAILLKNSGHCPQLERPFVTTAAIGQILKNQVPGKLGRNWWTVIK